MLDLRNLVVGYGRGKFVLHDVSLTVAEGEMAVVMGHNGAGKTTLLNAIFGLLEAERGQVLFRGHPLRGGVASRVRLGMTYSAAGQSIFPGLQVGENLDTAASISNTEPKEVRALKDTVFDLFPVLAERVNQRAGTLSGGQQRMLALGMSLMQKPKMLLLDEPSLGLAPLLVQHLYEIISRIRQELGSSVLVVEQTLNPSILNPDRLHILRMGRIVFSGGSEVFQDPERLWSLL